MDRSRKDIRRGTPPWALRRARKTAQEPRPAPHEFTPALVGQLGRTDPRVGHGADFSVDIPERLISPGQRACLFSTRAFPAIKLDADHFLLHVVQIVELAVPLSCQRFRDLDNPS